MAKTSEQCMKESLEKAKFTIGQLERDLARTSAEWDEGVKSAARLERRLIERESELIRLRDAFEHLKEALLEDRGLRTGCSLCESSSYHEEDCPLGQALHILHPGYEAHST